MVYKEGGEPFSVRNKKSLGEEWIKELVPFCAQHESD